MNTAKDPQPWHRTGGSGLYPKELTLHDCRTKVSFHSPIPHERNCRSQAEDAYTRVYFPNIECWVDLRVYHDLVPAQRKPLESREFEADHGEKQAHNHPTGEYKHSQRVLQLVSFSLERRSQ